MSQHGFARCVQRVVENDEEMRKYVSTPGPPSHECMNFLVYKDEGQIYPSFPHVTPVF